MPPDYSFFAKSNNHFIDAAIPSSEKIRRSHGAVPNVLSRNLPRNTPVNIHPGIIVPNCVESDRARIVFLLSSFLDMIIVNL